jgi:hypothetical protein
MERSKQVIIMFVVAATMFGILMPPAYAGVFPDHGGFRYYGNDYAESYFRWEAPYGWMYSDVGYEHDLLLNTKFFKSCTTWTNLPYGYDDCPTVDILEPTEGISTFSFGSFHINNVRSFVWYAEGWTFGGAGSDNSSEFTLAGQEVYHGYCWWDSIWCMKGTSRTPRTFVNGRLERGRELRVMW